MEASISVGVPCQHYNRQLCLHKNSPSIMEMTSKFLCVSNGLFEQASMLVRAHDLENQPKKIIGANYIDLSLIPKRK